MTVNQINNGKFSEKEMLQMRQLITYEVTEKLTLYFEKEMIDNFKKFAKGYYKELDSQSKPGPSKGK
jgi:hypothetical protein